VASEFAQGVTVTTRALWQFSVICAFWSVFIIIIIIITTKTAELLHCSSVNMWCILKNLAYHMHNFDIKMHVWERGVYYMQVINFSKNYLSQASYVMLRKHHCHLLTFRHVSCHFLLQGHCGACRRKWRLTDTDLCPCGETQTTSHIVESCPLTKLNGGLSRLQSADEDAVSWLTSYG